ncbi:MAG: PaaI family thioesterase [Methyloligellaceae bacterium]
MSPEELKAEGWEVIERDGMPSMEGDVWYRRLEGSHPEFGLLLKDKHKNPVGAIHGGVMMTFIDHFMGGHAFIAADRSSVVTIQLNSHFVSAAPLGSFVTLHSKAVKVTSSLVFMQGEIRHGEKVVFTADGIWKRVGKPGSKIP